MLTLTHAKFQLIETVRIPVAIIGTAFWPAASMLAFVVPFAGDDPQIATFATASMVTFAVMSTNLFQYGIGVSEDRSQPWDPYVRTLPAGALPRFGGRVLAGLAMMLVALLPVVVIAALFTAATITPLAFLTAVGVVALIAIPFILMGLAIGYSLPQKAAIVAAQVLFFPLAFAGGLMTAPGSAPGFIENIAPYVPTGGAVRLMWAAVGGFSRAAMVRCVPGRVDDRLGCLGRLGLSARRRSTFQLEARQAAPSMAVPVRRCGT